MASTTSRCVTQISYWLAIAAIALHQSNAAFAGEVRTWTSADGKFSTDAELVDYSDEEVRLLKTNGKQITVPLDRLSDSDKAQLSKSADHVYRVPGKLRVKNLKVGQKWAIEKEQKVGGIKVLVIKSGQDVSLAECVMIVSATRMPRMPPDNQKAGMAKAAAHASLEAMQQLGRVTKSQFKTERSNGSQLYLSQHELTRNDGEVLYIDMDTRFTDMTMFFVMTMSLKKADENRAVAVGDSVHKDG